MTTRPCRHRETLKKIQDGLSEEQKLNNLMLHKLYRIVLSGDKVHASILAKAINILFPQSDVMIADSKFRALWRIQDYKKAIMVYHRISREIFWYSERVSRFYERQGLRDKAIEEKIYLMGVYAKIGILPLPQGPVELFKIGKFLAHRNKIKARKYLELYLSAEEHWRNDPSFYLRKKEAQRILASLNSTNE